MDRVMISRPWCGIWAMQVCAAADVTDEEILNICNLQNPSGTESGWVKVIREDDEIISRRPGPCADYPGRVHFLVMC